MKILIDTNIIINALTGREPFRETAEKIFILAANQAIDSKNYICDQIAMMFTSQLIKHLKYISGYGGKDGKTIFIIERTV